MTTAIPDTPGQGNPSPTETPSANLTFLLNESQLIWSRYNSMLTANSIYMAIMAAIIAKSQNSTSDYTILVAAGTLGFVLTTLWFWSTWAGWSLSRHWGNAVNTLHFPHEPNPMAAFDLWKQKQLFRIDSLRVSAKLVIVVFMIANASIALWALFNLPSQGNDLTLPIDLGK